MHEPGRKQGAQLEFNSGQEGVKTQHRDACSILCCDTKQGSSASKSGERISCAFRWELQSCRGGKKVKNGPEGAKKPPTSAGRGRGSVRGFEELDGKYLRQQRLSPGRSRSRHSSWMHVLRGRRSSGVRKPLLARGSAAHLTTVALAPTCSHGAARTSFQFLTPCHVRRGR